MIFREGVLPQWEAMSTLQKYCVLGFLQNRAEMGFVTSQQVVKIVCLFKTGWRLWPPTRAISPGRGSRLSKPIDRTHIAQPCL